MKTHCQKKSQNSFEELTERQQQVLDMLLASAKQYGFQPSVREICSATGIASPNGVAGHLKSLRKKGYIGECLGARAIDLSPSMDR